MGRFQRVAAVPLFAALLGSMSGCGADEGESAHAGYEIGTVGEELSVKCGAGKYSSVQGADVSSWQGSFNWSSQAKSGMDFGYARISDGLGYIDSTFEGNWKKMKAAGILRGAYQYFEPGQSAKAQAELMVKKVGKLGSGDLPCVIDVEATGGQSPSTIASKVKTWLEIVEKGTGKKPIIYTGAYFWEDNVKSTGFGDYHLWIAAYGPSCPSVPKGWKNWTFWQYCDGQKQYCSNGAGFDRNVFNGSKGELLKLASGDKTLKAKAVKKWSDAKRYHGKHADYVACAGDKVKMSFTFKNVGSAVWRDVKGRGDKVGSDVFLVTANGKKDKITGHERYSVKLNANRHVRGDHDAKSCSTKNGCRKTTFIKGAMTGTAPEKPGIYHSRWRLRDFSKAWGKHSKGFGPKVDLSLRVVSCELPQQACGCRVWCNDGTSHKVSAAAVNDAASCKNVGATMCKPAQYLDSSFEACTAPPDPTPDPEPSGGAGGEGGTAGSGTAGASASGGTAGAAGGAAGTAGTAGTSSGGQGAGGDTSGNDDEAAEGEENDPNGYGYSDTDNADDEAEDVEDDADYDDGTFTGDEEGTSEPMEGASCSVASPRTEGAPFATAGVALICALAAARRRRGSKRTR